MSQLKDNLSRSNKPLTKHGTRRTMKSHFSCIPAPQASLSLFFTIVLEQKCFSYNRCEKNIQLVNKSVKIKASRGTEKKLKIMAKVHTLTLTKGVNK